MKLALIFLFSIAQSVYSNDLPEATESEISALTANSSDLLEIQEKPPFSFQETSPQIPSMTELQLTPVTQDLSTLSIPSDLPLKKTKSALLAVSLSSLIPGLGHTYLGEYRTAAELFGSTSFMIGATAFQSGLNHLDAPLDLPVITSNLWSYNIYAAYRDTRLYNGAAHYSYRMPNDRFTDLMFAPVRWEVLKKPEVWGGFLGALAVASGVSYFAYAKAPSAKVSLSSRPSISPLIALPVGIGEESLFRGFLQSSLAESCTPWGGIILSSLLFGAAHIPNGAFLSREDRVKYYTYSLPFITSLGTYLGWMTYKNHSIQESTALHVWYDFTLFAMEAAATKACIGKADFQFSFSF